MGPRVKIVVTEQELYLNTKNFRNHREYIDYRFRREHKLFVAQFHTTSSKGGGIKKGLEFLTTDSQIAPAFEVWGTVGESLLPIEAA